MSEPEYTIVVIAQRQPVDEPSLADCVHSEAAALGITVSLQWSDDLAESIASAGRSARPGDQLLVVTDASTTDLNSVVAAFAWAATRVDIAVRPPDASPQLAAHIQGRGLDGIRWALRAIANRRRWPVQRIAYGQHPEQFAELRLPTPLPSAP